ncbi:NUDIX domain-containing protein [Kutzneria sp. NPDC052558]|uniref:NUDIX domain-containing protein n=1 Tax=Kutzneria sp. NPDC052558 TaxID=3364121 RepID=UPI0037C78777
MAIVPGPGATVTFIRQQRGPYAGEVLLPGGKTEFGEGLAEAAAREAQEESGCVVERLELVGIYEIRSPSGGYHWVTSVFLAEEAAVPDGFEGHHVSAVFQADPAEVRPHPTVMRMLVDAGVAAYSTDEIDAMLTAADITMTSHLTRVVVPTR